MVSAAEYAEAKNRQKSPGFGWIKEPPKAILPFRD
jgi:hypothetical protein